MTGTRGADGKLISHGTVVVDTESSLSKRWICISTPPQFSIAEWTLAQDDHSVASRHPSYDPDEDIALVVDETTFIETIPYYTGSTYITPTDASSLLPRFSAVPVSRLKRVGVLRPVPIPTSTILPNRYHRQQYSVSDQKDLIDSIEPGGDPNKPPLLFPQSTDPPRFELLDGHKRVWAAAVVENETITCNVMYGSERRAIREWAYEHCTKYPQPTREAVIQQMAEDFERVNELVPNWVDVSTAVDRSHP
ncbi:ParB N-terminal domain-containing protein [Halobaculum sp. MBLA0147]|uniref:ParB N-terminal domain-containing protein n=1 Tax=Halobaculum sp. MBLA0147 TaxID=3079934 RepID=UPI0035252AAD